MHALATAWREVRFHPGRVAATFAAIIVAVGFLAATQVYSSTEAQAQQARAALPLSHADVVVSTHLWIGSGARGNRDEALQFAQQSLAKDARVTAVAPLSRIEATLVHGQSLTQVHLTSTVTDPRLRWYQLSEGRDPTSPTEVVLSRTSARVLGAQLGQPVRLSLPDNPKARVLTVVGLTDQRGFDPVPAYVTDDLVRALDDESPPVFPPSNDAGNRTALTSPGAEVSLLVATRSPGEATAVADDLQHQLTINAYLKISIEARTAETVRTATMAALTAHTNWQGALLGGSAMVSLVVGALIIANTFAILVAQRRRQIALLRVVGASRRQVLGQFLLEAVIIAVLGSVVGVATGIGLAALVCGVWTHALDFGLVVSWPRMAAIAGAGVMATVTAAVLPITSAAAVLPLEALRPAPSSATTRRTVVRAIGSVVVGLAGAVLLVRVTRSTGAASLAQKITTAAGAAALVSVAVLTASSLFVPPLIRGIGAPLSRLSTTARLASLNATRNPSRTGATAAALMLAVGLLVTVQVGAAAVRSSAFAHIDLRHPADVTVQSADNAAAGDDVRDSDGFVVGFGPDALRLAQQTPGVTAAALLNTSEPALVTARPGMTDWFSFTTLTPAAQRLLSHQVTVADGQIGLSAEKLAGLSVKPGEWVTVEPLVGTQLRLRAVEVSLGNALAVLSPKTLAALHTHLKPGLIIVQLDDQDDSARVITRLQTTLLESTPGLTIAGGAPEKVALRRIIDALTATLTGMLAVAALVALVGVANTLGLSVLERARESALLLALGLQRARLRSMLLVEALLLSGVSIVVGGGFGTWFGWSGAAAVARATGLPQPPLTVDAALTALTCTAVLLAGALASVLPGRRAAAAAPAAALAEDG